eukprot:1705534-Rhodomonas_salina.1
MILLDTATILCSTLPVLTALVKAETMHSVILSRVTVRILYTATTLMQYGGMTAAIPVLTALLKAEMALCTV